MWIEVGKLKPCHSIIESVCVYSQPVISGYFQQLKSIKEVINLLETAGMNAVEGQSVSPEEQAWVLYDLKGKLFEITEEN